MVDIDLDSLSLAELKALQKDVTKAVEDYDARRRKEAQVALEEKARELGFSLAELVEGLGKTSRKGRVPQPAKYRHPENASLT